MAQLLNDKQKEYGHDIFIVSDEPYREIVFEGVDAPMYPNSTTIHFPAIPIPNPYRCLVRESVM